MVLVSRQKWVGKISYPEFAVPFSKGDKSRTLEIIKSLGMIGPSTSRQIARNSLLNDYESPLPVNDYTAGNLEKIYHRIISGRNQKKSGRRKLNPRPNLEELSIVKSVIEKNSKNKEVKVYFLTLKGCFLAMGFQLSDDELQNVLSSAGRVHPLFQLFTFLIEFTSFDFVKNFVISPIQKMIMKGRIILDGDFLLTIWIASLCIASSFVNGHITNDPMASSLWGITKVKKTDRNNITKILNWIKKLEKSSNPEKKILDTIYKKGMPEYSWELDLNLEFIMTLLRTIKSEIHIMHKPLPKLN